MSVLKKITAEAKRIRKAHPKKYDRLSNPWGRGYVVEAARNVKRGKVTKVVRKKKKAVVGKARPKKSRSKRPRKVGTKRLPVVASKAVGRRRTKRKTAPRKVSTRRRSVGKKPNTTVKEKNKWQQITRC